ncbi:MULTISPECIES: zinc-dependent alcohol dehydrogenase family protein [Gracilibacillus]|uniref:zinc-dependent alcohol dehydrogenase family protein n=1 Tax=Gracilibacillus TaxID=74385 RepID=UPI00082417CF|nr:MULTISPECIES: zinc-dependent alcohol dehydrogenase family protein [Gracilibacillus]
MSNSAVLTGLKQLEVSSQTTPEVALDEVIIRVKNCGVCGTDLHIYHGYPGSAEVVPPRVLGHELAGEIVEVGEAVKDLQVGDRISVDPNIYCHTCEFCRKGLPNLCENLQAIGVTRDGGMAEYCAVPAANCYPIPDQMTFEEAALVEPLGCVLHGYKKLTIRPTDHILIIGGGFIGQLFLQLVKQQGTAKITVSEPMTDKHDKLKQLGATDTISPDAVSDAAPADIVIECVGRKDSVETAIQQAKKGGQVLLFGVASPELKAEIAPFEIFSKELRIFGSFVNPYTHEDAIQLIANKQVQVEGLISHRLKLDEVPELLHDYASFHVSKAVINLEQ